MPRGTRAAGRLRIFPASSFLSIAGRDRHTSILAPDYQSLVKQATLFEILKQLRRSSRSTAGARILPVLSSSRRLPKETQSSKIGPPMQTLLLEYASSSLCALCLLCLKQRQLSHSWPMLYFVPLTGPPLHSKLQSKLRRRSCRILRVAKSLHRL